MIGSVQTCHSHKIPPLAMARTVAFVLVLCVAIVGIATAADDCERRATSTAIPCPETWADKAFLIPHEGLRLLTTELSDAVNSPNFDVADHPWQASTLVTWFHSFYLPLVEHHHEVEERLYFPWMESRLTALGKTIPELPIGHAELMQLLASTNDAIEALATAEDPTAATAELRASLAAFVGKLLAHLEAEERLLTPLLLAHFTQEENVAVTNRIIQDLGWFGNKVGVCAAWLAALPLAEPVDHTRPCCRPFSTPWSSGADPRAWSGWRPRYQPRS